MSSRRTAGRAATVALVRPRSLGGRIALVALAVYMVYAATQMDLSLARAQEGLGHAARFFARLFPPNFERHELLVKGLLGSAPRTHDLATLSDQLNANFLARWERPVPRWIMSRLKEIASIDPGSTAFRYGENFDPALGISVPPVPSAMYVSLPHLQRAMLTLNSALQGAIAEIARDYPVQYFEELDFIDE